VFLTEVSFSIAARSVSTRGFLDWIRRTGICLAFSLIAGCAGNGEGLDENGRPIGEGDGDQPLVATFDSIQQNVFTPVCATGCHSGANAPLGLRLEEGVAFTMLVNVPSAEVPSIDRVEPGAPDASYLIQKLEGTAAVGERMPLDGPSLPQSTIDVIRQWITDGALPPAAATVAAPVATLALLAPWPQTQLSPDEAPPVVELLVAADRALDTTLLEAGTVTLEASGGDGGFDQGNERRIALQVTVTQFAPTAFRLVPAVPLAADGYRLTISGSAPLALADLGAIAIDGDRDGRPGGNYVVEFVSGGAP